MRSSLAKFFTRKFFDRHENPDHGDSETKNVVFNLCLVPDLSKEAGQKYAEQVIALSEASTKKGFFWFFRKPRSCYTLHKNPNKNGSIGSNPHVTISHGVYEDALKNTATIENEFAKAMAEFVGKKITLSAAGILSFNGPPFDRLAQATKQEKSRLPKGTKDRVLWIEFDSNKDLRKLRYDIGVAVAVSSKSKARCFGAEGDDMKPHGTFFVGRVMKYLKKNYFPKLPKNIVFLPSDVPFLVAFSKCGPYGQAPELTTNPKEVGKIMRSACTPQPAPQ